MSKNKLLVLTALICLALSACSSGAEKDEEKKESKAAVEAASEGIAVVDAEEATEAYSDKNIVFQGGPADGAVYTIYKDGTLVVTPDAEGTTGKVYDYLEKDAYFTRIVLEPGVKEVSSDAFRDICWDVTELVIPDTLEEIGERAFLNIGIEELVIPENVNKIWSRAFTASKIKTVVFPENMELLSDAFFYCKYIKEMTVPGYVKTVSSYFFGDCEGLEKAAFEEGAEILGEDVFYGCSNLKEVYLPSTLKEINCSFPACDVYYAGSESDWNAIKFKYNYLTEDATLHFGN